MKITSVRADHYRIPLPMALSDSTHGVMTHFAPVPVRLACDSGREGGLPLATGENLHTVYEFEHMIADGCIAFQARRDQHRRDHRLAQGRRARRRPLGLEAFMAHPLRIEEGYALAPKRPRHGATLDWAALEEHRDRG
jgi:L-alanine-DL-glutamate epimerase-like enolase superfamily enzyme